MSGRSPAFQRTLAHTLTCEGIGLHTGQSIRCQLHPAAPHLGRIFVRTDLPDAPEIPATLDHLGPAHLSTRLVAGAAQVQTIEHLLAALTGLGIDNCRIELNGPEAPILDGSALPWVEAILTAGIQAQDQLRQLAQIDHPVTVWQGEAFVSAIPAPNLRFTYGIDFPDSPMRQQWHSSDLAAPAFVHGIAPARTFAREQDLEPARQQGLIKGGSLDNAIVCTPEGWHTPLRFEDEPVRHKLIDLLGDLSLLGVRLQGHILAYKAGHALHHQLSRQLRQTQALTLSSASEAPDPLPI